MLFRKTAQQHLAMQAENHGKSWKILIRPMPFSLLRLCLMPFGWTIPFSAKVPAHHDGGPKKVWPFRGYAFSQVWLKVGSTVSSILLSYTLKTLTGQAATAQRSVLPVARLCDCTPYWICKVGAFPSSSSLFLFSFSFFFFFTPQTSVSSPFCLSGVRSVIRFSPKNLVPEIINWLALVVCNLGLLAQG